MVEVWLFGRLLAALSSAFALVLVIVALTSITYLAVTLAPALRLPIHASLGEHGSERAARWIGISAAVATMVVAAMGLRVGAPGAGGELVPTISTAVALATALGASSAFLMFGGARAALVLGGARVRRSHALEGRRQGEAKRLAETRRAFLDGDDLRAQLAAADAAVGRLRAALTNLEATRAEVESRLARLDDAALEGDLGVELRRARDEVTTKLELGGKILHAAETAAFRIATSAPLARLLRQRPRHVAQTLTGAEPAALPESLAEAAAGIDGFLTRAADARAELEALATRRGSGPIDDDDPLQQALRDVDAVEEAYRAVRERLDVVRMRVTARADLDAVASAAGEVSEKARASGLPASELQDLVDEVMRAESAILMATPADLDPKALAATLSRGTAALGAHDGASLDELLRALRELT
ncbi:Hypothetical protein A7982_03843 [Minicystis rosea]|nr:Hypothetical protein A7982_03843 [Minicystis rosea]